MAWTPPRTWVALETVTAALFNTHVRDNLIALRDGGIAIASQAAQDFLFAASSTQLGRLAAVAGRVPEYNGSAWVMVVNPTVSGARPVGSIYESVVSTDPGTLFGGTWAALGPGRVLVGIDAGQAEFDTVRETGGAKTHTLTTGEMPVHTHIQNAHDHTFSNIGNSVDVSVIDEDLSVVDNAGTKTTSSVTATNQNAGSGAAHNNLQPYYVIYRWERTA